MNDIDATSHYERASTGPAPSLLVVVLDTNPQAWATLSSSLSLSTAVSNLLVFINAHLAFSHENKVAVIASHCQRAEWLYPSPTKPKTTSTTNGDEIKGNSRSEGENRDVDATTYRPFRLLQEEVVTNLQNLMRNTTEEDLLSTNTTLLAGALTLALSYINKASLAAARTATAPTSTSSRQGPGHAQFPTTSSRPAADMTTSTGNAPSSNLTSRILVVSTSGNLSSQYISIMNAIFAAQHSGTLVDVLKLAGDTVLLQQASYTTRGVFLSPLPASPASEQDSTEALLQALLQAFLPDASARVHLNLAALSAVDVDFRAACFCHQRVVDIGFVCSICLSIFCAPPEGNVCLTCGTKLRLQSSSLEGGDEEPRKKKKKKKLLQDDGAAQSGSEL